MLKRGWGFKGLLNTKGKSLYAKDLFSLTNNMTITFGPRFVERNGEADYLDIIPGDGGGYAIIPYRPGGGRHEVGLEQNGCVTLKITVHELLHALGIKHEQSRLVT